MTAKTRVPKSPAPGSATTRFFPTAAAFRRWLEREHARATELWLGFYRKDSGKKGISYPEAVDAALCYGWIDGIRKKLDDISYVNRFTPRKPGSVWSTVNIGHVKRLTEAGLMHPAGLAAFARRDPKKSGIYSFEQRPKAFPPALEARFRTHHSGWAYFTAQPPGYQRLGIWFVMSAKREETQLKRLERLIEASDLGIRLGVLFGQTAPASGKATAGRTAKARVPAGLKSRRSTRR